jgi:GntR family transcriptional repressor for pyruvate dehydrogenase complex
MSSPDFLRRIEGRTTLTADVCRKLVSHLIRGDWTEGERLPAERELCQRLGVGRASLREALKALEIMGMIETRLGDGTFVCHRSEFFSRPLLWAITGSDQEDARELVEARRLMEVELAGLAAERATPEDIQTIERYMREMEMGVRNQEVFLEADLAFHLAVGEAAHNRILINALHLIRNLMRQWIQNTISRDDITLHVLKQHQDILHAIVQKSQFGARAAMQVHLDAMARALMQPRTNSTQV